MAQPQCPTVFKAKLRTHRNPPPERLAMVVGALGFEPRTPCAQGRCATRLRYAPTVLTCFDSKLLPRTTPLPIAAGKTTDAAVLRRSRSYNASGGKARQFIPLSSGSTFSLY